MFGLGVTDIVVIVIYFVVIMYIGIRASFAIKKQEDYLLGGRKFGKLTSTFASFGQATSADGPAGVTTTTFTNGASGIWSSLLMLFVTPLFWITSPWLRRLRLTTMGDFYVARYKSKKMAAVYALVASIGMMGLLSVGYMAVVKTAIAMTPKTEEVMTVEERQELNESQRLFDLREKNYNYLSALEKEELETLTIKEPKSVFSFLDEEVLIWSICILVILYTALGGLEAAFYTDMLQGVFIILLSIILIPFSWAKINATYGGSGAMQAMKHLHDYLPERFFEIFGSPMTLDFTWYYIASAALVAGVTVVVQPNQLVTAGAAKNEEAARVGFVTGTYMKRFVTMLWGVVGLCAILLFSGKIVDSDLVWGHATRSLLGPLNLGLVGLMLASMMAALMSTADCLMLTVSGLILNNLYKPFVPNKSEKHYIWVSRISGSLFLVGAAIVTMQFDNILQMLKFIWEFFVIFAAAFWLGLKWRKATRQAAWASIIVAFLCFYLLPLLIPTIYPALREKETMLLKTAPRVFERVYEAKKMDVADREQEILDWEKASLISKDVGERPEAIKIGEQITEVFSLPQKSIFWSKGIKQDDSKVEYGSGYIFGELWLLQNMGFQLQHNPYALNETIRLLIRLLVPFLILLLVSLFGKGKTQSVESFFVTMRTKVNPNSLKEDAEDVEKAQANPEKTRELLLFKNSSWEFYKWNRKDVKGFLIASAIVFLFIAFMHLITIIGT